MRAKREFVSLEEWEELDGESVEIKVTDVSAMTTQVWATADNGDSYLIAEYAHDADD